MAPDLFYLFHACHFREPYCLDLNALKTWSSQNKTTPLHWAVYFGKKNAVLELLKQGNVVINSCELERKVYCKQVRSSSASQNYF